MFRILIEYFAKRHLLTNFIAAGVLIGAIFAWHETGKEAMPDVAFDILRISTGYKNATPADIEYFITEPLEKSITGVSGIEYITSTSSSSQSSITVEIENNPKERNNIIAEIKSRVLETRLPDEADTPGIREIKTSERSVLDIALIDRSRKTLDSESRLRLQRYADSLKNRIERVDEVREVNESGYLDREIRILLNPGRLSFYNISITEVIDALTQNNFRLPAGAVKDREEIKVSIVSELDTIEKIKNLVIRGTFEGAVIKLKDLAAIEEVFEENTSIAKYNSHEGVRLNIVKKASAGIIEANDMIMNAVNSFRTAALKDTEIDIVLMDDESTSVRDRLSMISTNGLIGFVLVIIVLFLFLDFSSGFWVAAGIPFSFCFAMIFVYLSGYTINNMTMAAVILVMGMVVDDAIIVAENIGRMRHNGVDRLTAVIEGTDYVIKPVFASIFTTCVAFIPLLFFSGRFGSFVSFIPLIIFLMLCGSLLEALFILPSHLSIKLPDFLKRKNKREKGHWFEKVEDLYGWILVKLLSVKFILYILLILILYLAWYISDTKMSFALFPREEVTRVNLEGWAPPGSDKYETARLAEQVEEIFTPYLGREIIAFRTNIAVSRRGAAVDENRFTIRLELVTRDKREKSSNQLTGEWEEQFAGVEGLDDLRFTRGWFGQSSGSPVEIIIQENNDRTREEIAARIAQELKAIPGILNSEVEEQRKFFEYLIDIKKELAMRLNISVSSVSRTIRTILNSVEVFALKGEGDRDVAVLVSVPDHNKNTIEKALAIPVKNSGGYLVPLKDITDFKKVQSPEVIRREDLFRTLRVYADIDRESGITPAEAGSIIEQEIFNNIINDYPSASVKFGGEIRDTRESGNDFLYSAIAVVVIIFIILALLFNSILKPFIIMLTIPFGAAGVVFALYLHGITVYGFFSAIGLLGLAGVVINNSIVMLVKLDREYDMTKGKSIKERVAVIAKTRLRAVFLTTITTVAGLMPTAYGIAGYDSMLSDMMLVMAWGLIFGTIITLLIIPMVYCTLMKLRSFWRHDEALL